MEKTNILDNEELIGALEKLEIMHPEAMCALEHRNRFQLLVAVMLSAQTTDISVNKVTPALFERYPDAETLAVAAQNDVEELIRTIGLYRNKSANIIKMARMLTDIYGGIVPGDYDSLVSLPGVGRKTANVVLAEGFGVPRIAVDTHVFRVANRIGITSGKDVTETEEQLMTRLPEDRWIRSHHLLIFHGRKVCHARKPDCCSCLLNDICIHCRKT